MSHPPVTAHVPALPDPGADGAREFAGRTALVTGAARGIGRAVVHALAARGAQVLATDLEAPDVGDLAAAHDGRIASLALDVRDSAAVDAAVAHAEDALGPLDVAVNVAGVLWSSSVVDLTDEEWAAHFAVNTTGVFHVSRAAARRMTGRGRGSVVTVASNAAGIPRAGLSAYAASKAAAVMFTKCLGLEVAARGVRCNTVSPGSTMTDMQRGLWTEGEAEASARRVVEGDLAAHRTGIPLGRIADPRDVAEAVVFLASDRARHITLHDLYVDGGATLRA
ncbi:2,3-dihydro-2,3-dihydroxybenzoate dehydrogenase [Streptomyces sp. UH6]|nr:2,3-dihydro-2,3-dihydroxybenzoate dehydrogenase [Streptomyces sp. UH6]